MSDPATLVPPALSSADTPAANAAVAGLLAEITADLSTGADMRALLGHFLEPIVQLAHARAGAVRMLCDDDRLRLVSQRGLPPQLGCAGPSVHRHCGGCGLAVDGDRLAWDTGLHGCDGSARDTLVSMGWAHMLAVPLDHRGQVLGVYNLFFDDADGPPVEVRTVLRSIGTLLGLALHNARLEAENLRATVLQERQRMAAEVHDAVAQDLAFLRMRVPLLEQAIGEHNGALTTRYLVDLKQALGHAHGSLREIITDFRTPPDPRGLAHALAERADEFGRRSGVAVALHNDLPSLALPAAHESQLLHIVGEALSNIARHARARQAWLRLSARQGRIELRVEDDGQGLGPRPVEPGHHGLEIMAGRAQRLGGTLELRPREGGGTVVAVVFPAPGAS